MKLKFRKGLKLNIAGAVPAGATPENVPVNHCAIVPDDYPGFMPKVAVKEGDEVACGSAVLFDKSHPDVKLVSPLAGKVKAVVRGDRRKILRVEIEAAGVSVTAPELSAPVDASSARAFLAQSGLLALMRQRPYDIVPNPADKVRDIFVTAIDSAPLAAKEATLGASVFNKEDFEAGVAVLNLISDGKVYVATDETWSYGALKGAEMIEVEGPHPSGNVSVQIAAISPVDKGDVVWTLDAETLARIGRTAKTRRFNADTVVAVVCPEVKKPALLTTLLGAPVEPLVKGRLTDDNRHLRIISGNVLSGVAVDPADGYLHYPYRQITVIAEGDDVDEFMGWASLSPSKMSQSRSFPGHFLHKLFRPDARLNGSRRAMIMSGQYEATLPMDIMPEYLIKAILSHNIEDMEKLGIYEVAPEDFAAAEYVDTSKLPLQQIVRDGLDYLRKELE